jgi:hypothetical protein
VPAVIPVPDSAMFKEGLDAVLAIVTLPVTAPATLGANVAVKLVLCPAFNTRGTEIPLTLKPLPVADAWLIVTLDEPPLVSVMVCD